VARRSPTLPIAFGQIAVTALLALLVLPFLPFEWPQTWPGLWPAVGVTGLVCTTIALGLMVWGQARVPAEAAAVVFALEPIWAALFEWLYMGTSLGPMQWSAGVLVVGSVVLAARAPVPGG
jgi:drug/metabolite transporter (DMT)-like permease